MKYGMAYQLSNNQIGVYFNDSSKLIQDLENYIYYERQGVKKIDVALKFKSDEVPKNCEKKVLIHENFVRYINGDISVGDTT